MKSRFEELGFVRLDRSLPAGLVGEMQERLRQDAGPAARSMKLGDYADPLFVSAFDNPVLRSALDGVLGEGQWRRPAAMEDVRAKHPGPERPPWWHIDVFERDPQTREEDVLSWRASLDAGGVCALAIILLSDVEEAGAPIALRAGSHHLVAERLAAQPDGMSLGELLETGIADDTAAAPVTLASGAAGTTYLCQPLLVHTALTNRGRGVVFNAVQPIFRA